MDIETFRNLPAAEVARILREAGGKVVVFPFNGTRRWYMLEHASDRNIESIYDQYRIVTAKRLVETIQLLFDHGVRTLLIPSFGGELLTRGEAYLKMMVEGMAQLASYPPFLEFYEAYDVRVHFYGNYRQVLANTPYAHLLSMFHGVTQRTSAHDRFRLFYGLFANDATEAVAEFAVRHHAEHGRVPARQEIVEMYYGEYVDPVDFFIGFDKFSAFDMPLLALGEEDLYFTVAPSFYLSQRQLRDILYDHLYTRRVEEGDNWEVMREFYRANMDRTLGVGAQHEGFWHPLPQVNLPLDFKSHERC